MGVEIDWGALGEVCLVSFGAAVGVIVLFAFGVSAIAPPVTDPIVASSETAEVAAAPRATVRPLAVFCFLACVVVPDPTRGLLFDFDEFLTRRGRDTREVFVPGDSGADYDASVDGKLRRVVARAFLVSRRIELTTGTPGAPRRTSVTCWLAAMPWALSTSNQPSRRERWAAECTYPPSGPTTSGRSGRDNWFIGDCPGVCFWTIIRSAWQQNRLRPGPRSLP